MTKTIESTEICPHCGQAFYLPSDCQEHVKAAHLDFGRKSGIFATLDPPEETMSGAPPQTRIKEVNQRRHGQT